MTTDGPVVPINIAATPTISVCTLVTRWDEYEIMRASFLAHGFADYCTEYLVVDNTRGNTADAYRAINAFLQEASAPYIIICHQDVELIDDGLVDLEQQIADMTARDPTWGVLGNAGSTPDGRRVMRLSDPHGSDQHPSDLPAIVTALDENFLLVRREANLAVSRDLSGFHHYGHDLCIVADVLGWSSYVIDFHLLHKSAGSLDNSFRVSRRATVNKYSRAFRPRCIAGTTQQAYLIGGSWFEQKIERLKLGGGRLWRRVARRLGLSYTTRDALDTAPIKASTKRLPPVAKATRRGP